MFVAFLLTMFLGAGCTAAPVEQLSVVAPAEHHHQFMARRLRTLEKEVAELRRLVRAPTSRSRKQSTAEATCASDPDAHAALVSVKTICCDQLGEACVNKLPSSCDTVDCASIVQSTKSTCEAWLTGDQTYIGATWAGLNAAASECSATAPADDPALSTSFLSNTGSGTPTEVSSCTGLLRSQPGGAYGDSWNKKAHIVAPLGWRVHLSFLAFDVAEDDYFKVFDGAQSDGVILASLSGDTLPSDINSTSNVMDVQLLTNQRGTSFGVTARVGCVCDDCAKGSCVASDGSTIDGVCGLHGTCQKQTGSCQCDHGYSGPHCETADRNRLCTTSAWPARVERVAHACAVDRARNFTGTDSGHRRLQSACGDLNHRVNELNAECCNEASEDCSTGVPSTCNAGCAAIMVPFKDDCLAEFSAQFPGAIQQLTDAVAACQSSAVTTITLPEICPSLACATEFAQFYEDCQSRLGQHPSDISTSQAVALEADCDSFARASATSQGCRCSACADDNQTAASLCLPWRDERPCNCTGPPHGATQAYPVSSATPPCCRKEWPATTTVWQMTAADQEVLSATDVLLKINGEITFVWTGFENVEQVDSNGANAQRVTAGLRSGNPVNGGQFKHTFTIPGDYFFQSYVSKTMRVKVSVKDCDYCSVISSYSGSHARDFAVAVSSQTAGDYNLQVSDYAAVSVLTVYAGQTVRLHGATAPAGQLALLDGNIRILESGTLVLDGVHVSGNVAVDTGGTMQQIGSNLVTPQNGLAVPHIPRPFPRCEPRAAGSLLWDSTESTRGSLMQCGVSGMWSKASEVRFDASDVVVFVEELQRVYNENPDLSAGQFNLGVTRDVTIEDLLEASDRAGKCPGGKYNSNVGSSPCSSASRSDSRLRGHGCACDPAYARLRAGTQVSIIGTGSIQRPAWTHEMHYRVYNTNQFTQDNTDLFSMDAGSSLTLNHLAFSGDGSCYSPSGSSSTCPRLVHASSGTSCTLVVKDCVISSWSSHSGTIYQSGGAIAFDSGTYIVIDVADSVFRNNHGGRGGALYITGSHARVMISNTDFHGNTGTYSSQGDTTNAIYWGSVSTAQVVIGGSSSNCFQDTNARCFTDGRVAFFGYAADQPELSPTNSGPTSNTCVDDPMGLLAALGVDCSMLLLNAVVQVGDTSASCGATVDDVAGLTVQALCPQTCAAC